MKTGLPQFNVFVINSMAGETVPLNVTSTSANVKFALPASWANYDVICVNNGTKIAFVNFGVGSGVVAVVPGTTGTTGATPIPPNGAMVVLQKNTDAVKADTCAAICGGTDTTTLYFTSVQGS